MKTFSAEMEICRQRRDHDVAWLVEIDWDGEVGRYSSRPVTIGGAAYRPIVAAIRGLRLAMPPVVPDGGGADRPVEVELVNTAEEGDDRFEVAAGEQLLEGRTVRVGFVFLDPTLVLDPADIIWIQTYQIEAAVLETAKAVLRLRESPWPAGRRLVGRRLLPGVDPQLSPAGAGRMVPLVFGRIERSPLIPFRVGRRSYLREALQVADTVIAVEDASVFPESGLVQINDEILAYAAVDRANGTLGRGDSPVVRTAPAYHRRGAAVDSIPENGFEFLAADHPCRSVGPIYSGEHAVSASDYVVDTEVIGGRAVQKVMFPTLPTYVDVSATAQTLRIDGQSAEGLWASGGGNAAHDPLAAVDAADPTTAATVDASQTPLEVEYCGDLTQGGSVYGPLSRCRLVVEYSASQRWSVATDVEVTVGRGASSASRLLGRPAFEETLATFPSHSHADSIRDRVDDTRELFEIAEQSVVVDFDTAQTSSGWAEAERAIDGNLGSWCENAPPGSPPETAPVTFRLLREPLGGDEAVELEAVAFVARLATDGTGPVSAALEASIAGKYVNSWFVEVGSAPQTFECALEVSGLTIADLMASATEFAVHSTGGDHLKVSGAWLCLAYRPRISGREQTAAQRRTGEIAAAAPLPVSLPTHAYRQTLDLSDFVQAQGGWGFFGPSSGNRPFVRVIFGASGDPTAVRISAMAFEIEYAPREDVAVFDRFDATVEGIEESGELVENPADVMEWLVTNEAGLGWGSETIDAASFQAARQWLDGRDWKVSRRIGAPTLLSGLLEELAQESGCRLVWEAGRFRLLPVASILLSSDAVATFDGDSILSAPLAKRAAPITSIANVVRVHRSGQYTLDGGERRVRGVQWIELVDEGSAALAWGRREREFRARWHASSPPERLTQLAALWLGRTALPGRTVELDVPVSQAHLERGDVVVVDHAATRLTNAVGEIAGVEFVDGRYVRATVAIQALAMYCWYGDAETFIAHLPGNGEKTFVLEGTRVASLDRTGRLRLAGVVREAGLPAHAMSAPIEHDAGAHRLYFGVGDEQAGYAAVFALDNEGRLLLSGTARESVDLSALSTDTCHEGQTTQFLFSCDLTTVVFRYDAAADRLELAGGIVEGAAV